MRQFEVTYSSDGSSVTVRAEDEFEARRIAMVERYGSAPSDAVPYAPNYRGEGCFAREVRR
jgi:hypothetical protein